MKKDNILKGAGVLLITAVMILSAVTVTANTIEVKNIAPLTRDIIFEDGFETYDDWLIDFPPWTTIDVNGDPTFGHNQHSWPHQWEAYAFIIFNPSTTTPPMTDPNAQPHTGDKYCAGFNNDNTGYTNDDWLISPQLGPADYEEVSFWAKSFSDQYNYELFEVSVSTTDTNPASFTVISPVESPGHTAYEQFTYSLNDYDGQSIYIGIHMISIDSWFLLIDDFSVTGAAGEPLVADADGPYEADEGEDIQFQGSATGGDPPYSYEWDFGNGDTSDVQNPVYAYDEAGVYDVTLTVTDNAAATDDDATTATINEIPCCFEYEILPGFGIGLRAEVTEICNESQTGVPWEFNITGGLIVIPISPLSGTADFTAGETKIIRALLVLGIGSIAITFTIDDCDPREVNAFIIGPFVIVR